jgi:hypothetical protein
MKYKSKEINIAIQDVSEKLMKKWMTMLFGRIGKRLFVKLKYRPITNSLCEYVCELVVCRAADRDNDAWYNERLAASANLFALLFTRDGLRFIRNFDDEAEAILQSRKMSPRARNLIEHWQLFAESANQWREKYYPSKSKS